HCTRSRDHCGIVRRRGSPNPSGRAFDIPAKNSNPSGRTRSTHGVLDQLVQSRRILTSSYPCLYSCHRQRGQIRGRLRIDDSAAVKVIDEYRALWHAQSGALAPEATKTETLAGFRDSYPLHPDVLDTFTGKTATLANFQRVRGMLRILGRTVSRLWE